MELKGLGLEDIIFPCESLEFNEGFTSDNGSQAYTIGTNTSQQNLAASTMIWIMVSMFRAQI